MRPSRIIAFVDAMVIGGASAVFLRSGRLGLTIASVSVAVMWAGGAYRPRIYYRVSTQLPALLVQLAIAALLVSAWPGPHRLRILAFLPATVLVVVAARLATFAALRAFRRHSPHTGEALIIGADGRGCMVAEALLHNRVCGITPIGFVDTRKTDADTPLPIVADLDHLDQVISRLGIKHVIVAKPDDAEAKVSTRLWQCQARDIDVWTVPALFELSADPCAAATDELWAIPFQHLRRPGQHTGARVVKRAFDFAVAATIALLMAPVLIVVALAVRLTSAGPIFFRQRRVGQNGRSFELLKFRTMMVNSDSDTMWSVQDHRRMTAIGRFLRRSCLDELPQMFNVLRGDMSLVGPRPERPFFDDHFRMTVDHYSDRLRAPMGITGWAQIHGLRGDTSIAERTRFDNFYIEHWSLWLDVVIMGRTLTSLLHWMIRSDTVPSVGPEVRAQMPAPAKVANVANVANVGGNQS